MSGETKAIDEVFTARLVISISSAIMLLIIIVGSILYKVHTAPRFVMSQVLLIGLSNLGGLVMSWSLPLLKEDIYHNTFTTCW